MDPELRHNRALWTLLNHRYTGDAAMRMWERDGIRWGLFGVPDRWLPTVSGKRRGGTRRGDRVLLSRVGPGRRSRSQW